YPSRSIFSRNFTVHWVCKPPDTFRCSAFRSNASYRPKMTRRSGKPCCRVMYMIRALRWPGAWQATQAFLLQQTTSLFTDNCSSTGVNTAAIGISGKKRWTYLHPNNRQPVDGGLDSIGVTPIPAKPTHPGWHRPPHLAIPVIPAPVYG